MLNLQQKAHYSLDEFRKGRGSPLGRAEPLTPADDNDELSVLGGKTRLVAKQEPSSPTIMDRSPTSHNPVVPLPLSPSMEGRVHPSVWEYLDSFAPSQSQNQNQDQSSLLQHSPSLSTGLSSSHNSYSEDVSMYGMSTLPAASTFQPEPASYLPSPTATMHSFSNHRQGSQSSQMGNVQTNSSSAGPSANGAQLSFPQYFPVYDYGNAMNNTRMNNVNGHGFGPASATEAPLSHGSRRASGSGSPETNLQSTWQDFVSEMAI